MGISASSEIHTLFYFSVRIPQPALQILTNATGFFGLYLFLAFSQQRLNNAVRVIKAERPNFARAKN
jgi:hypothetical protein